MFFYRWLVCVMPVIFGTESDTFHRSTAFRHVLWQVKASPRKWLQPRSHLSPTMASLHVAHEIRSIAQDELHSWHFEHLIHTQIQNAILIHVICNELTMLNFQSKFWHHRWAFVEYLATPSILYALPFNFETKTAFFLIGYAGSARSTFFLAFPVLHDCCSSQLEIALSLVVASFWL